jgi:macrodomain Ter protein organizer (MatP/YcbG family)
MGKRGNRSVRGVGEMYPEPKTKVQVVKLTLFAYLRMRKSAKDRNLSYSEYVEQLIRSDEQSDSPDEQLTGLDSDWDDDLNGELS